MMNNTRIVMTINIKNTPPEPVGGAGAHYE